MKPVIIATVLGSLACATASQPTERCASIGMSLAEASKLVDDFERLSGASAGEVRPAPTSVDDVLAILKSDQIDRFPAGGIGHNRLESDVTQKLNARGFYIDCCDLATQLGQSSGNCRSEIAQSHNSERSVFHNILSYDYFFFGKYNLASSGGSSKGKCQS